MASATAIEADGSWLKAAHAKRRVSGSERAEVPFHTTVGSVKLGRQKVGVSQAFNDWFVNDRSMSANGSQYTGRFQFLPIDRYADHTVVSVAAGVYYKEKDRRDTSVPQPSRGQPIPVLRGHRQVRGQVVHNAIQSNTCGVKGPIEGNTVKRNVLDGNTTDSCQ